MLFSHAIFGVRSHCINFRLLTISSCICRGAEILFTLANTVAKQKPAVKLFDSQRTLIVLSAVGGRLVFSSITTASQELHERRWSAITARSTYNLERANIVLNIRPKTGEKACTRKVSSTWPLQSQKCSLLRLKRPIFLVQALSPEVCSSTIP